MTDDETVKIQCDKCHRETKTSGVISGVFCMKGPEKVQVETRKVRKSSSDDNNPNKGADNL